MLKQAFKEHITEVEQYVNLNTVNELKAMPFETRDEKMLMAIRLQKLINGMSFEGRINTNISKPFNLQVHKQALSNAASFHAKTTIAVWALAKMLENILCDLELELPSKPNKKTLFDLIDAEDTETFDSFFEDQFTDGEKKLLSAKKEDDNVTWSSDLDWKAKKFSVILADKSEYKIDARADMMKIKNPDLLFILEKTDVKEGVTGELQEMYSNIEVFIPQARRSVYQMILTAALFRQPYTKYPALVTKYKFLKEFKAKNNK